MNVGIQHNASMGSEITSPKRVTCKAGEHREARPIVRVRRRGSLYVAVLGVTMIVSMLALSAMHVARLHLKSTHSQGARQQARLLATSAIELAIAEFNSNPNWAGDYALNTEYPVTPVSVGGGTFTWKLVDAGGGERRLDGVGVVGDAACKLSVDLNQPADLDCGLLAGDDLVLWNFTESLTVNGAPAATNSDLANYGAITADVEAKTVSAMGTINGSLTNGAAQRRMPNPNDIFEYYLANGTVIDPPGGGAGEIKDTVLSPSSNPFGTPNPMGIYIVDGSAGSLVITNARIVGTLVVVGMTGGSTVNVTEKVNWEPAYSYFPAIMVDGDLTIGLGDEDLDEAALTTPNLNPTGTPYVGVSDSDESDTYPTAIAGLVYCSGNLLFDGLNRNTAPSIQGMVIVGGVCKLQYKVNPVIDFDPTFAGAPGFGNPPSVEQSWLDQNSSNSGSGTNYTLGGANGVAAYFAPSLPPEATSWAITRVAVYCNNGGSADDFQAQVTTADAFKRPDQVVESLTIQESSLPSSFEWHEITFANATGFSPGEGACLAFLSGTNAGAQLKCGTGSFGSPETHRLTTTDSGSSWTVESSNDMWIKVWGTYTIGGGAVSIRPGSWRITPGS